MARITSPAKMKRFKNSMVSSNIISDPGKQARGRNNARQGFAVPTQILMGNAGGPRLRLLDTHETDHPGTNMGPQHRADHPAQGFAVRQVGFGHLE